MATVSIVVLTFNSEKYIERCLLSLARQSFADFEVIVVDAGSTDQTQEIVGRFDTRFRWFELAAADMGAARNYGVGMSQGQYLMFLDSDDFYLRHKIEKQVTALSTHPAADVMFCSAWHFRTGSPHRVGLKRFGNRTLTFRDFLAGLNHNLNTMCVRRSVWERGFRFGEGDRGRYGEEWRLQLAMSCAGVSMSFHNEPLVVVEIRRDSHTTWSRQWTMKAQAIEEIERIVGKMSTEERLDLKVQDIISNFYAKLVIALLVDGRTEQAMRAARAIDGQRGRQFRWAVLLSQRLPRAPLSNLLQLCWLARQNRSFSWQPTPITLRDEFLAVGAVSYAGSC